MIPLPLLSGEPYLYDGGNLARIPDVYDIRDGSGWPDGSEQQLLDACRDAEVIITARQTPRLPDGLIDDVGRLRWVCHLNGTIRHPIGREHLEAGITVTNWGDTIRPVVEGTLTAGRLPGCGRRSWLPRRS